MLDNEQAEIEAELIDVSDASADIDVDDAGEQDVPGDDDVAEASEQSEEPEASDEPETSEGQTTADADDGDLVVSFGDEEPEESPTSKDPERESSTFSAMRKREREKTKQIKELEARLAKYEEAEKPTLGPKPTLEGSDYDTAKFEAALERWHETKRAHDAEQQKEKAVQEEAQAAWEQRLAKYQEAKAGLKVRDYQEAEEIVQDTLNVTQQGVIISEVKDPALLVYALGKNPKKLDELASITDPVKFIFAVARMETQLKTSSRKPAPAPEKTVTGSGSTSGANATLEKLRNEAARTGDFSKVHAYKRKLKAQGKI